MLGHVDSRLTAGRSLKQRLLRVEPAICRLLFCAGASLALHALTLGARGPAGTSATYDRHANTPVIQATLMPGPPSSASTASPSESQRGHPVTQSHVLQQANSPQVDLRSRKEELARTDAGDREPVSIAYPVPDKWHTAEEVDVRAEPLTPVPLGYPEHFGGNRIRGRVRMALFIDERGWVRKAQVLASEPERLFDDVAIQAWQDVRFSPALKGDLPVKSEKLLEIDFMPY